MKIAILGAGAMGSVYGAFFARAGNDVWLVDRRVDHMAAIQSDGLRVSGASGDWRAYPRATIYPADVGVCDLVVVATKGPDLAEALRSVPALAGETGCVLAIQNGLGAADELLKVVAAERAQVGIAGGFGASIQESGHVHHNGLELVMLAALAPAGRARAQDIAEAWTRAGFHAQAADDVDRMIWSKLICNAAYSAVCCITGLRIGEVLDDADAFHLAGKCAAEAISVAAAHNIDLEISDPVDYVRRFGQRIPSAKPSLLLDRLSGRRGEIDYINGAVVKAAERVGVSAMTNGALVDLVRAMETYDLRPPLRGQP
ncbi:MAG: ketopantoate reductase family protein [bacterium]